ncbi:MAG: hypothetical protein PVI23_04795 [Maricaulaceae bacterium]|jgi:hypothetical protein
MKLLPALTGFTFALASGACTYYGDTDRITDRALDKAWRPARAAVLERGDWNTFAVVSRRTALSRDWMVLTFSAAPLAPQGVDGRMGWIVRREYGRWDVPASVDWASSTNCDALENVLLGMEDLRAPGIDAPRTGWEQDDEIIVSADGASYRLVANRFQFRHVTAWSFIELDAGSGSSVGEWVEDAIVALAPCWSPQPPIVYD